MENDTPYRELLGAVLRLAFEEAKRPDRLGEDARHWLAHSPVARDYLVLMDLDPDEVIRRLAA
jgi:hypothetical protein